MWSGIVLLQNQITLLHKRDCNRTQDLIPIPYCGHIARNNNQLWFYPVSNASPDHNRATPKPIPFGNTDVGKAFSATSVHTTSKTVNLALVNSIQRRIRAATAARGGHPRYWFSVWFWFQDLGGSYQWTSITRDLLITNQWNLELLFHTCTVL